MLVANCLELLSALASTEHKCGWGQGMESLDGDRSSFILENSLSGTIEYQLEVG